MRPPLVTLLLLFYSYNTCRCGSTSSLVEIACRRQPSLSFCHQEETTVRPPALPSSSRAKDIPLSANDRLIMEDIANSVKKAGGNPFEKMRSTREERLDNGRKDSDLREKDSDSEGFILEEGEGNRETLRSPSRGKEDSSFSSSPSSSFSSSSSASFSSDPSSTPLPETTTEDTEEHNGFRGGKAEYCDNYEQHFSFYCVGEHSSDGNEETLGKFCVSYKRACPNKAITSKSVTSWPADPFSAKTRIPARAKEVSQEKSEEQEVTEQELYHAELKRRFPCKPDCDQRLFPHCTAECKCDYLYPAVQRFCNPPPMPMFLNTCRLWYNGCPKYEAYHYASQFIYSKAEKGKVLPGQPQANNPNPYNIPQPTLNNRPFRTEGAPTQLRPLARAAVTSPDLVVPPELPTNFKEVMENRKIEKERIEVFERVQKKHKKKRSHRKKKATVTTKAPPTPKELYKGLKTLAALTADPAKLTQDIIGQGAGGGKARARGSSSFPVIPSDAAYGTDEGFNKFDSLTDSRGILHRPRSSSPFTKPGLWEANPADPHNRDHPNKYWYHPRSVGVDWLNGQMTWGAHWAVPAAGVGGTDGFSALHFPTVGTFLNIPDDYD